MATGTWIIRERASRRRVAQVFIDEIDSVGRARGGDDSAATHDADNTLNQLLVELDGFGARDESQPVVVVMAATNRQNVLDAALLRKGRFDHVVTARRPRGEPTFLTGRS